MSINITSYLKELTKTMEGINYLYFLINELKENKDEDKLNYMKFSIFNLDTIDPDTKVNLTTYISDCINSFAKEE